MTELDDLRAENETLRARLAACLLAARGEPVIVDGWSPAVKEVLELRRKYDALLPPPATSISEMPVGAWEIGDDLYYQQAVQLAKEFPVDDNELRRMMQRKFIIGWIHATRLIEELKAKGER